MTTTKCNIRIEDNAKIKTWALQASAKEGTIIHASEIIRRLIDSYESRHGDNPPIGNFGKKGKCNT